MLPHEKPQQGGRRIYGQGGAAYDHGIRAAHRRHGPPPNLLIQGFPIEHHFRLDKAAALVAMGHPLAVADIIPVKKPVAFHAAVPFHVSMDRIDPLAARLLVQAVDVLGDHRVQLTRRLQPGQGIVRWIGRCGHQQNALIIIIKNIRMGQEEIVGQQHLRRIAKALLRGLRRALAAEVRYPAFRGYPGAP